MKTLWTKAEAWYKGLDEDTRTLVWVVAACLGLLIVVVLV